MRHGRGDRRRLAADLLSPLDRRFYRQLPRRGVRPARRPTHCDDFEIPNLVQVVIDDDVEKAADMVRHVARLLHRRHGRREVNFHANVFGRMGYEAEVHKIQDLFLDGQKDEAIASVPLALVEDVALVGPRDKVREELDAVEGDVHHDDARRRPAQAARQMADLVGD